MQIDFATAGRIIFGAGKLNDLPQIIKGYGNKVFLVRSKSLAVRSHLTGMLESLGIKWVEQIVSGEPNTEGIKTAVQTARSENCDFVIGIGGGSVIDTGKAVAALLTNSGDLMDYLEVVGLGKKLEFPAKPYIAVPTTAGTGSEVTRNAVISVPDQRVKVSMRSPYMLPRVALVDPELTYSMPPGLTASTGMDAFIQVIEPYVTGNPNPMVDMFCRDAIPRGAKYLLAAYQNGNNVEARTNMSWVSLMGGLSLANAKLGAAHGFAGPIGGMFHAPHGAICAAVMPGVMQVNIEVLREREPESPYLQRYGEIAQWITGDPQASEKDGGEWIKELCQKLKIPGLSDLGIKREDFDLIVEKAGRSSSMKGNPIKLTPPEMKKILELSL